MVTIEVVSINDGLFDGRREEVSMRVELFEVFGSEGSVKRIKANVDGTRTDLL